MSDPTLPLALGQINIVVRDLREPLVFYRRLGPSLQAIPLPEWAPHHASGVASKGMQVEFDSFAFAKQWNPGLDEAKLGSATLPFFTRRASQGSCRRLTAFAHSSFPHRPRTTLSNTSMPLFPSDPLLNVAATGPGLG